MLHSRSLKLTAALMNLHADMLQQKSLALNYYLSNVPALAFLSAVSHQTIRVNKFQSIHAYD